MNRCASPFGSRTGEYDLHPDHTLITRVRLELPTLCFGAWRARSVLRGVDLRRGPQWPAALGAGVLIVNIHPGRVVAISDRFADALVTILFAGRPHAVLILHHRARREREAKTTALLRASAMRHGLGSRLLNASSAV